MLLATFLNLFPAQLLNLNFWELESDWPILGQVPTYDPGIGWCRGKQSNNKSCPKVQTSIYEIHPRDIVYSMVTVVNTGLCI